MLPSPEAASVWRPHVTVACVVARGERYQKDEEEDGGRHEYNQPAGHLDDGESLVEAVVRETLEETGWTIALEHFLGVHQWRSTEHGQGVVRFSFAARPLAHDPMRRLDLGIRRALWLSRDEIVALGSRLRSPMVQLSIDAWLSGQRQPLETLSSQLRERP